MIQAHDRGVQFSINVLDSMIFASDAWSRVKSLTIANCFNKAGFIQQVPAPDPADDDDFDVVFQTLSHVLDLPPEITAEAYINFDCNVETSGVATVDDIVALVQARRDEPVEDEPAAAEETITLPTSRDALMALETLERYFIGSDHCLGIQAMRTVVEKQSIPNMKQTLISRFFE